MFILYRYTQRVLVVISFIILLLCINFWIMPLFLINALHAKGIIFENLNRFAALGYVFTSPAFLVFALAYTKKIKILTTFVFWLLLLLPAIIFLYLSWSTNTISIHSYSSAVLYAWGYETPIGTYFPVYVLWFELNMITGTVLLIRHYRSVQEYIKRKQAFYVTASVLVPLSIGSVTNGILPMINVYILPAGVLLASCISPIIVFAIYKYGLFEVTPLTILSNINQAIITIDKKGNVLQMNRFSEKMLNVKAAQILGVPLDQILILRNKTSKSANVLKSLVKHVIEKGKSISSDMYTIMNNRQHIYPFTISITPMYADEAIVGANILLQDLRKEKARERHKDEFINILSHELKTPITSIKAMNQLLMRQFTDANDTNKRLSKRIDQETDRLNRLIQDYFELSRVQTGKMKLHPEIVNIDKLIREIVDTLSITYPERQLEIEGKTNGTVLLDKDRITQTIINLVNNAIKYSPPKKKILVLLSSDQRQVTIGVRDYGKGIAPEYQKKIFDQFYQIESGSQKTKGLGIGLFIANHIVKLHGGKMWIESVLNSGSTFYFTLPLNK